MLVIKEFYANEPDYSIMSVFETWLNDQEEAGYQFVEIICNNFKKGLKDSGYYGYSAKILFRKIDG